jgi:hypothetical protein
MHYDILIRGNDYGTAGSRKIADIKALREATRMPTNNGLSPPGLVMGLTEAKAAIEQMYADGKATLRLTPEQFATWTYNYNWNGAAPANDRDWYWDTTEVYFPEPAKRVFSY